MARVHCAAHLLGLPWVAFVDSLQGSSPLAAWSRQRLANADLLVARSPAVATALRDLGVAAERVLLRPYPARAEAPGQDAGQLQVLACGPLGLDRGWEDLLLAMAALRQRGMSARLRLLGSEVNRDESSLASAALLRGMVQGFGLNAELEFCDQLAIGPLHALFNRRPAVLVAPWRGIVGPRAIDLAILTAMANDTPILCTASASDGALVSPAEAELVEPGNAEALCSALLQIGSDRRSADAMAARARRRHAAEFAPWLTRASLAERLRLLLPR